MTEAEALKRFIPILGRISTPGERATITRNILERIAGQKTSVMGVSHKHAGALAWPNDHVKALAFERALDAAVDAGEFVSFLHCADRHHFQIEELSAWPNCPKVDTESPLTYWLSNAAQTARADEQGAATSTPAVTAAAVHEEADRAVKPWLIVDPVDPPASQRWYTPARYFARQLVLKDSTLLTKRLVLAEKVSQSLYTAGIYKRGGKNRLAAETVLKAFSNVSLG
jgi:hypothetical protein